MAARRRSTRSGDPACMAFSLFGLSYTLERRSARSAKVGNPPNSAGLRAEDGRPLWGHNPVIAGDRAQCRLRVAIIGFGGRLSRGSRGGALFGREDPFRRGAFPKNLKNRLPTLTARRPNRIGRLTRS